MKSRSFLVGVLGGVAGSILIGFFAVPALGVFEMTATGKPGILDWWGNTNWKSSLEWRAPEATVPETADGSAGIEHYTASCLQCHGAPGASRAEWAHQMQPMPPKLWEKQTQEMSDGKLFHVVRGGVRMTGMPAFGPQHSDDDIWNIVAFVKQLDELSDSQKQQLAAASEKSGHHEHGEETSGHRSPHHAGSGGGAESDHHSSEGGSDHHSSESH